LTPKFLKPNDQIAIVAPSGRIFPMEIQDGLNLIDQWNLESKLSNHLFEDYFHNGYHFAGDENQKVADFQQALDDDEIKAIWCARGGYGAVRILDLINWEKFKQNPKWIIGYSDITAIHNHVNNWNIATIHGITIKKLNTEYSEESFNSLKSILFGEKFKYKIQPHPLNQLGSVSGKLVGGNLSIIYSLTGSHSAIQGEDLILFIEDWNENWYHIDRILTNLDRNGFPSKIKGLIVGSFTKMDTKEDNLDFDNPYDPTTYKVIKNILNKYKIPMCFQFPAGHIGDNRAMIFGENINLSINENNVTLEFNSLK